MRSRSKKRSSRPAADWVCHSEWGWVAWHQVSLKYRPIRYLLAFTILHFLAQSLAWLILRQAWPHFLAFHSAWAAGQIQAQAREENYWEHFIIGGYLVDKSASLSWKFVLKTKMQKPVYWRWWVCWGSKLSCQRLIAEYLRRLVVSEESRTGWWTPWGCC